MSLVESPLLRRVRIPAYVILLIGGAFPIVDWLTTIQPLQMGSVPWRFGVAGLAANLVVGPLVTFVLIYAFALAFGDRKIVLTVGILAALASLAVLLITGSFTLDAVQMRSQVRPEQLDRFYLTAGQAWLKLLAQVIGAAILAVSALRAFGAMGPGATRGAGRAQPIVTAPKPARPATPAHGGATRPPSSARA